VSDWTSPASRGTRSKETAARVKESRPRRPGSIAITHVRRKRETAAPRSNRSRVTGPGESIAKYYVAVSCG
jgi:hypothetical protein